MTLILDNTVAGKPQTHVLIIGVGRYPHLQGGVGPLTPQVPLLGQLTSPPISARALADWFINPPNPNPIAKVGSVELLISDANNQQYTPHGKPTETIEDATMENIELAFNAWYGRCDTNDDNIAIFYFCGHGLEVTDMILLPEDFGRNNFNAWKTGINFNKTYRGMSECAANTQYYIIDACRQWTTGMLKDLDSSNTPTLKSLTIGKNKKRTARKLFASAPGLPAFGDSKDVSQLTKALLKCLNGGAAEKKNGEWFISTSYLGEAVQKLLQAENVNLPPDQQQIVDPGGGEQHLGAKKLYAFPKGFVPNVSVSFGCIPEAAITAARFYYRRNGERHASSSTGSWSIDLEAGVYDFGVEFLSGVYTDRINTEEWVLPPIYPVDLEV